MNSRLSVLGVLWAVIAIGTAGYGLATRSGILIAIGMLMIFVASWNAAIRFRARGLSKP